MLKEQSAHGATRTRRESVHDEIRKRIFEGIYTPGTRLVERDLAEEFSVSRSPIRESLRMLRQEGLVRDSSRGAVVAGLSAEEVIDLFEVRLALEVLACEVAAQRAAKKDLERLLDLVRRAETGLERGSVSEVRMANSDFHDAITDIAGNDFLRSALEPLQGRMHWLFRDTTDLRELVEEHRRLYEAIASGDPRRAASASASHINKYRRSYCALEHKAIEPNGAADAANESVV